MIRKLVRKLHMLMVAVTTFFVPAIVYANELGGQGSAADNPNSVKMYLAIASGLAIALAAMGGALGQGRAAAAALEGIARNPGSQSKVMTPLILALALIESLVIYAFLIAIFLQAKISLPPIGG